MQVGVVVEKLREGSKGFRATFFIWVVEITSVTKHPNRN